jgi:hypothetical protein
MSEHYVDLNELFLNASVGQVQTAMAVNCAYYIAVVPYPLMVTSGWFAFYGTVTGTASNYHRISLCRRRGSSFDRISVGYTKPSGLSNWGGTLTYGTAYSWNSFGFDADSAQCLPGDQLAVEITAGGSPTAPKGPMVVTVGYTPS